MFADAAGIVWQRGSGQLGREELERLVDELVSGVEPSDAGRTQVGGRTPAVTGGNPENPEPPESREPYNRRIFQAG